MNQKIIVKKTPRLLTILCLACLIQNKAQATDFQLPPEAFKDGGISTSPQYVIELKKQLENAEGAVDVGASIDGVTGMTNITTRITAQSDSINPASPAISNAVSAVYALTGQPTGNSTDSIATRIGTPAQTNLTTTIGGSPGTISARLGNPGNTRTLVNNIQNGGVSVQAAITTVQGNLANTANASLTTNHDLNRMIMDGNTGARSGLVAKITGNTNFSLLEAIEEAANALDGAAAGSINGANPNTLLGKIEATSNMLVNVPGANLQADVDKVNGLFRGLGAFVSTEGLIGVPQLNATPSTLSAVIGGAPLDGTVTVGSLLGDPGAGKTIVGNIGGSTTSVQAGLNDLSTLVAGNTTFATSLVAQVTTLSTTVDNSVSSLPGSASSATIGTSPVGDGSGGVNLGITGLGAADGTYNLSAAAIASGGGIANGATFTLTNGANNIVLYNRSGSVISTAGQAIKYLATMYPVNSRMATGLAAKISNGLNVQIGGAASNIRAKVAAVDAAILVSPTGVVKDDLNTIASKLVSVPNSILETDIRDVNTIINGIPGSSTIQDRLGAPTINGVASNLSAVIGGAGGTIVSRLGDPVTGTSGLAGLIRNNGAAVGPVNGFDAAAFDNAQDINAQITAFLAVLSQSNGLGGNFIQVPKGTFTSLRDFLAALNMA